MTSINHIASESMRKSKPLLLFGTFVRDMLREREREKERGRERERGTEREREGQRERGAERDGERWLTDTE